MHAKRNKQTKNSFSQLNSIREMETCIDCETSICSYASTNISLMLIDSVCMVAIVHMFALFYCQGYWRLYQRHYNNVMIESKGASSSNLLSISHYVGEIQKKKKKKILRCNNCVVNKPFQIISINIRMHS